MHRSLIYTRLQPVFVILVQNSSCNPTSPAPKKTQHTGMKLFRLGFFFAVSFCLIWQKKINSGQKLSFFFKKKAAPKFWTLYTPGTNVQNKIAEPLLAIDK